MNDIRLQAIIATDSSREKIMPGGAPVFLSASSEEQQKLALLLSRILDTGVYDLENGLLVLVKH